MYFRFPIQLMGVLKSLVYVKILVRLTRFILNWELAKIEFAMVGLKILIWMIRFILKWELNIPVRSAPSTQVLVMVTRFPSMIISLSVTHKLRFTIIIGLAGIISFAFMIMGVGGIISTSSHSWLVTISSRPVVFMTSFQFVINPVTMSK